MPLPPEAAVDALALSNACRPGIPHPCGSCCPAAGIKPPYSQLSQHQQHASHALLLQGLAAMKAVGIARLQQCSLVVVPEADRELATGQPVAMTVFVLVDF